MTAGAPKTGSGPMRALFISAGLLVVLLGGAFFALFERIEDSEAVGASGRALRDQYWAATLLLEEMGVPTSVRYGLGQLPAPTEGAVVIVLAGTPIHRNALATRLVPWVQQGGHLVVTPKPHHDVILTDLFTSDMDSWEQLDPEQDQLLSAFGVPVQRPDSGPFIEDTVVEVDTLASGDNATVNSLVTRSRFGVGADPCEAVVGTAKPSNEVADEPEMRLQLRAQCGFGQGLVTVLSSVDLIHNDHLRDERGDNAAFFWDSVAPGLRDSPPSQAIIVLRGEAPSFIALLWDRAWPALTSLALLMLAWAHFAGQRFGVQVDRPQLARRSMLEHLDAAGSLLYRAGRRAQLVAPMRAAVRQKLARRMPALAHLQGDDLALAVADATGRPIDSVRLALVDPPPDDRLSFVRLAQTLQLLWRAS